MKNLLLSAGVLMAVGTVSAQEIATPAEPVAYVDGNFTMPQTFNVTVHSFSLNGINETMTYGHSQRFAANQNLKCWEDGYKAKCEDAPSMIRYVQWDYCSYDSNGYYNSYFNSALDTFSREKVYHNQYSFGSWSQESDVDVSHFGWSNLTADGETYSLLSTFIDGGGYYDYIYHYDDNGYYSHYTYEYIENEDKELNLYFRDSDGALLFSELGGENSSTVHYFDGGLKNDAELNKQTYRTYFPCDYAFEMYPDLEETPAEVALQTYVDAVFEKFGHSEEGGQLVMNRDELAKYLKSLGRFDRSFSKLLSLNAMFFADRNEDGFVSKKEFTRFLKEFMH